MPSTDVPPPDRHSYASECRLAPIAYPEPTGWLSGIPPLQAQFFYTSPIPIDDPLAAATSIGASDGRSSKSVTRPFSQGDNNALEKAWLGLSSPDRVQSHEHARRNRSPSPALARSNAKRLAAIVDKLVAKHNSKHAGCDLPAGLSSTLDDVETPACCPELAVDAAEELGASFCRVLRTRDPEYQPEGLIQEIMARLGQMKTSASDGPLPRDSSLPSNLPLPPSVPTPDMTSLSDKSELPDPPEPNPMGNQDRSSPMPSSQGLALGQQTQSTPAARRVIPMRAPAPDDGISGLPFVRVGTPSGLPASSAPSLAPLDEPSLHTQQSDQGADGNAPRKGNQLPQEPIASRESLAIPVGVSRLHMVTLPALQMEPIYWSPVNDIAVVLRGTWFYRDTFYPVEPRVANQLEAGYRELRPWTETWADEIRCAIEVGALGEEKVSHPLWVRDDDARYKKSRPPTSEASISSDPFCAAHCFQGEAAAEGTLDPVETDIDLDHNPSDLPRNYASYDVIYMDSSTAFLLKPSLKPSAYYGRRPVSRLKKGATIGIPVVRGFNRGAWSRIHENGKEVSPKELPLAPEPEDGHGLIECPGCRSEKQRHQVSDLVLVVHGVGQKLAERVESFHFTHAINAFRRAINVELGNDSVRAVLRGDHTGVMVLPVNWRAAALMNDQDSTFSLQDIEPPTIPAVRSIISDVMFDVPFYMSHHKASMIEALIFSANGVYRKWCANNPGFAEEGRVHIIAHSLGSAMSIEVLSRRQPAVVLGLDIANPSPQPQYFEFNTTNLFLLGSPASFFLLLEQGKLLPRRGRAKPGADLQDTVAGEIVGDMGTFGCLAVDNVYNILAREDPIAYLLNSSLDRVYASSLKVAYVPSARPGLIASVGNAVRAYLPGDPGRVTDGLSTPSKPPTVRLPSQLEMEVHDFSREEIAERKAFLLNDNGQIDYFLRSGGGPLEIQYLNMLSAHTSYWTNLDLIRLLCVEIGRKPGRANTIPAMRAVKASKRFVGV